MTAEDQGQLERYLWRTKARARSIFKTPHRWTRESANVVGEIRGRENAEQVLWCGAHLDSWDLSEGIPTTARARPACWAADAIVRSGMKPRRTIRFVLFTGEEQAWTAHSLHQAAPAERQITSEIW